jgi:hypothetical protein
MFRRIIEIFSVLKNTPRDRYSFKNISNSIIKIISRPDFEVAENWFERLLTISYDKEIKSKYIPKLHEINNFERENLTDIINFQQWKGDYTNQLKICMDYIDSFKDSYRDFFQFLEAEGIKITKADHLYIRQIDELKNNLSTIETELTNLKTFLNAEGYEVLSVKNQLNNVDNPILNIVDFRRNKWSEFLDKEPQEFNILNSVFQYHNQVYHELNSFNGMLHKFKTTSFHKIIAGKAGTGKTHISAYLIEKIGINGDYVLFFKPKQFNGDDVNFDKRLLELLQIPKGYTLNEILEKLNNFAISNNRRCFFIIDALNETTKASIGFSNIWSNNLQEFINQISLFSHLYFICTLRISYIENIWSIRPTSLTEIKGFETIKDLNAACKRYFEYYKIKALNFNTADLSVFRVPLLLDLYCRLINEPRVEQKDISLDMNTYLQIFENYVVSVSTEVQRKLDLQKRKLINVGFSQSADKFFQNNEAVISIDDFSDAFDADDSVTSDSSIARAVLEGYLIFIKDLVNRNDEIVKHTQQEVGGYLLAKNLSEKFPIIVDLLNDKEFDEKVTGNDINKHHQLRLDILKFLIALRPEVISYLKGKESLGLSWWFLYNGFRPEIGGDIPQYLLSENTKDLSLEEILKVSMNHWFNPDNEYNFNFVAKVLEKLVLWEFDLSWSFYIYKEVDLFYELILENTRRIDEFEVDYNKIVAKFIAFSTATNIRELRDLATIYLIKFGKKHPVELLELTEYSINLPDDYIYERLASCCYGVALIFQNDEEFIHNVLPEIARRLFQLQFEEKATHPVFNYIVIDSIKHLIDLAIYKGVFSLNEALREQLNNYQFPVPFVWKDPSEEQRELINKSSEMSWPEPIGMDFGIYTIPRLINSEYSQKREAIANVYKRIFELGYQVSNYIEFKDEQFRDFYFGHQIYGIEGKVDKLGKKYSWKGFFDFAGVLLRNGKLDIYEKYSGKEYYERLSDVDIDICMPSKNYKLTKRLYDQNLIIDRDKNPEWYRDVKIDTITPLFELDFENTSYIMLYGKVEQRIDEEYKTRLTLWLKRRGLQSFLPLKPTSGNGRRTRSKTKSKTISVGSLELSRPS